MTGIRRSQHPEYEDWLSRSAWEKKGYVPSGNGSDPVMAFGWGGHYYIFSPDSVRPMTEEEREERRAEHREYQRAYRNHRREEADRWRREREEEERIRKEEEVARERRLAATYRYYLVRIDGMDIPLWYRSAVNYIVGTYVKVPLRKREYDDYTDRYDWIDYRAVGVIVEAWEGVGRDAPYDVDRTREIVGVSRGPVYEEAKKVIENEGRIEHVRDERDDR